MVRESHGASWIAEHLFSAIWGLRWLDFLPVGRQFLNQGNLQDRRKWSSQDAPLKTLMNCGVPR